jgi:CDP-6-deoxy-D-xylo-4-hexulose-3-dehydrase
MSTIEGGFVSTDDEELYEILKSIRSHGWDRDASTEYSKELRDKWKTSNFDALYTFYHSGFNLRSTDLQAFIGLGQIDKLDDICKKRNENFKIYQEELGDLSPNIKERGFISNFAYPVIHEYRNAMVARLQNENIEVRPMICGSMGTQPFYVKKYGRKELPNVSQIDLYGFYIPNHPGLTKKEILKITSIIKNTAAERFVDPYLQTR